MSSAAPAAHTAKLVSTPPSLKEKKGQRQALAYVLEQLRLIPSESIDRFVESCPLIEYVGNMVINHLPSSAPLEHCVDTVLEVYQTLYAGQHDPELVKHITLYLIEKGVIARAPLLKQAGAALASIAKHALA